MDQRLGQELIDKLIKNKDDMMFNDLEKAFVRDLVGKKYETLSARDKACVTRCIGWLEGVDCE